MITEKELLAKKFDYIQLEVLEKDESENALVFSARVETTKLENRLLSEGQFELNGALLNQQSPDRPPGYWVLGSPESEGVMTCIFASDEWLENTPKEEAEKKRKGWQV